MKRLFKKFDIVKVEGNVSNADYNVRVCSHGIVSCDQTTSSSNVLVTVDEIDGDHHACVSFSPKLVSLVKEGLPRIKSDDTARVWVNEAAGLVMTDFLGSDDDMDIDDIDQGFTAYSMTSVYHFDKFPDKKFDLSKLDDVNDGSIDYDKGTVDCNGSSMTLMHDTDEYDKKEHFEIILDMLPKDGWKQVVGPFFDDN